MALSNATFGDIGGAASDIFAGFGAQTQANLKAKSLGIQAQGELAEGQEYDLAAGFAQQNAAFTKQSTAIQEAQQQRQTTLQLGAQRADVAGAGLAASGSALDLMRNSASQGALSQAVLGQQGLITEAGYEEQAQSYQTMSSAAKATAASEEELAQETEQAGKQSEFGDFISGAIKGVAAVASIALAPETGGLSLAGLGILGSSGGTAP